MKICIVIPCHRLKARWLRQYLDSIIGKAGDIPIIVAVTNSQELRFFREHLHDHSVIGNVLFFDCLDYLQRRGYHDLAHRLQSNTNGGIINLKKLIALKGCLDCGYDYMLLFDCDSVAVSDLAMLCDRAVENYQRQVYFGARGEAECYRTINQQSGAIIAGAGVDDATPYPWFFDVPVYRADDLQAFFDSFASFQALLEQITWHTFEHLLYIFFLVSRGRARLVDYGEIGIKINAEFLMKSDLDRIETAYSYRPLWMTRRAYQSGGALMICHVDRDKKAIPT